MVVFARLLLQAFEGNQISTEVLTGAHTYCVIIVYFLPIVQIADIYLWAR